MQHLESLFERALDAVVGMDCMGKVTAWNGAATQIFGWTREEALGANMGTLIVPPQHRAGHAKGLAHYNRTGEGPVLEQKVKITALNRQGREFPVELSIFPMQGPDGTDGFYAFIRSLEAEEAARRAQELRAEEGKALLAVAQRLLDDISFEDFTRFCLETVCRVAGMEAGHMLVARGTGEDARLYPTNIWHLADPKFHPVIEATTTVHFGAGEGLPGQAWSRRELQSEDNLTESRTFLRRDTFVEAGLSRAVALPVWEGREIYGVLEFFGTAEARLDDEVLRLIRTIGSQIGIAITRKSTADFRETLRREMIHRVGNSLTVLSSIYRSCSRSAASKEELDEIYLNRLVAVSRANRLAVESTSQSARIADLVEAATDVFPDRHRVEIEAEEISVQSDSVMPLALVLSELATNTLKHADMESAGVLRITARRAPDDRVQIDWHESFARLEGPAAAPAARSGFGTTLLRSMIEDQLGGQFERHCDGAGFRMVIDLPRLRLEGGKNVAETSPETAPAGSVAAGAAAKG